MKRAVFSPHKDVYIQYFKNTEKHDMPVQHYHDTYEIYLLLGGKRYLFYDNTCYILKRGDLAVLKPFDIHYSESREADCYERYVLNFKEDNLSKILSDGEKTLLLDKLIPCVIHLTEEQTKKLYDYFERTCAYSKKTGFLAEKLLYSALLQLIAYVAERIDGVVEAHGNDISPQIMSALKYMNKSYMEGLTLDDIAEAACMSKYHFCRKFKEITGATVLEYLNNVRLTKVHNLLMNTQLSIDEIADKTGFSSAIQLTRVFKGTYGMSPSAFRKARVCNKKV